MLTHSKQASRSAENTGSCVKTKSSSAETELPAHAPSCLCSFSSQLTNTQDFPNLPADWEGVEILACSFMYLVGEYCIGCFSVPRNPDVHRHRRGSSLRPGNISLQGLQNRLGFSGGETEHFGYLLSQESDLCSQYCLGKVFDQVRKAKPETKKK